MHSAGDTENNSEDLRGPYRNELGNRSEIEVRAWVSEAEANKSSDNVVSEGAALQSTLYGIPANCSFPTVFRNSVTTIVS